MAGQAYNIGIDILKLLACFGVVGLHFGSKCGAWALFSVPVFMLVSIYLSREFIFAGKDLRKRIKRLYVPFAIWGAIYWLTLGIVEHNFSVIALIQQLTIGVPVGPHLYFMFLLLVNTLMLVGIFRLGRAARWVLGACLAMSLLVQYTGINSIVFKELPFYPKMALGRFLEFLPPAICGCLLGAVAQTWTCCILSGIIFSLMTIFGVHCRCLGFEYQGLYMLLGTVAVSSLAIELGQWFTNMIPAKAARMVRYLASLTPGIYYAHLMIGKLIELPMGKHRGIFEMSLVFLVSACFVAIAKRIDKIKWLVA